MPKPVRSGLAYTPRRGKRGSHAGVRRRPTRPTLPIANADLASGEQRHRDAAVAEAERHYKLEAFGAPRKVGATESAGARYRALVAKLSAGSAAAISRGCFRASESDADE